MIGFQTRLFHDDLSNPGRVGVGHAVLHGGDHHTDAVLPQEGHTVGIALGGDEVLNLRLGHGIVRHGLDGRVGLIHRALVGLLILCGLLEQGEGVVPGLLPVEAGCGEVSTRLGVRALLGRGALLGLGPLFPSGAFLCGRPLLLLLQQRIILTAHQGRLPQVFPGGGVLRIAPVQIDRPTDKQDDGRGDGIAFPEFHRFFLTFLD